MSYLKVRHNSRICLDPTYPDIDHEKFDHDANWTAFYGDVEEAIPWLMATNSVPKTAPSTVACFLVCQLIKAIVKKIK